MNERSPDALRLQFSGHETFPLRYGWLKKVVDVLENGVSSSGSNIFASDEAIALFGVGRNMVSSMRHWALSTQIMEFRKDKGFYLSDFGRFLFSDDGGIDPFLENLASLWLLHWKLASALERATTWHLAFHHFSRKSFDRDALVLEAKGFSLVRGQDQVATKTLQRDVDCFINSYVMRKSGRGRFGEETLECPLTELRLITETARKGVYEFHVGSKKSLPDAVFIYALKEFTESSVGETTFSLERVTYDPGSPGRAFKLDENSVADRLSRIEDISGGVFSWVETGGLRQVQLSQPKVKATGLLLMLDFDAVDRAVAA